MSLLCKLIDHKYGNVTTREETEERNNQTISISIRTHECTRCNHVKENRIRTIVEPDEDKDESASKDTTDITKEYNENNSIVQQNKALNDDMISSERDDSIILTENENSLKNDAQSKTTTVNISCQSCDFNKVEKEKHRRNGDFCPECGGWLQVD